MGNQSQSQVRMKIGLRKAERKGRDTTSLRAALLSSLALQIAKEILVSIKQRYYVYICKVVSDNKALPEKLEVHFSKA